MPATKLKPMTTSERYGGFSRKPVFNGREPKQPSGWLVLLLFVLTLLFLWLTR